MAVVLVFVALLLFLLYKFSVRNFDYWEKKGVPFLKPVPFFGNFLDVFLGRMNIGFCLAKCYDHFSTPYFGIYILNRPYLVIKSPDLVRRVLVQDFNYFYDHTMIRNEEADPIGANVLFLSKNPEWKFLRQKMAPAYTAGRVKKMLPLVNEVGESMKKYINQRGSEFCMNAKQLSIKYGVDVIASIGFGVNANCFESDNAKLEIVAEKVFSCKGIIGFRQMCSFLIPSLVKLFKMPFFDPSSTKLIKEVISTVIKEREGNPSVRNDTIDVIMNIRNTSSSDDLLKIEGDIAVAQAYQFYIAGLESSSTTIAFTLYEFCIHPEIQDKVRAEIKNVVTQHGGFTYEAIQDMKYLHMVVSETLRKYTIVPFLDRMCMADYKVPGSDLVIEKGTPIYIPSYGLHFDPHYFPEPQKFDPERFSDENRNKFPSFVYLPFGEGPRSCIGERFGIQITMLGLAHLLSEVVVECSPETPIPLSFDPMGFILSSTVALNMKFKKSPLFTP